jgi:hypothetical protein
MAMHLFILLNSNYTEQNSFLETDNRSPDQKFISCYGPRMFITMFTIVQLETLPQMDESST